MGGVIDGSCKNSNLDPEEIIRLNPFAIELI
jgi:hypothetical protein